MLQHLLLAVFEMEKLHDTPKFLGFGIQTNKNSKPADG